MPELPEVELVSSSLNTLILGRTIVTAELIRQRLAPDTPVADFANALANRRVTSVGRRGKHILIGIDRSKTLIVHLRMSGRFCLVQAETEAPRFTHAIFTLDGGERLLFSDQRHFGLMKLVDTDQLAQAKEIAKLAPEPFSEEFSIDYFRRALSSSARSLKEVLLDQTKVCGLGNIYASEALFAARIDPTTPANTLGAVRVKRLYDSIKAVLHEAISHNIGRPIDPENLEGSYFSGAGSAGWYVYGREDESCTNCETPIVRLKQGGRSTFYCRRCQRK
ncbi:MAG: bifunctional DNA-formamidopyrimidine glycosylase/DNA-(apurinic or apyrimidinic site) lyase [Chloracidobacterium sp.]|nr:bifunctional DNA-formamidopyrimidine glycosylase/DNA-(apurinic or apyrimidinic site) lyase [Chloracidobacterium sp.]